MSTLLTAELAATCNALGYFDTNTNKYYTDENVLETLKDLIRYLRRDDENFDVRRHLGETKVLQTDLLPLLKNYWEEQDLFDVLLRLLVNLTTPALILWNEEVPTEKLTRNRYLQIEEHLQNYKQAFADDSIWAILSTKLSKILELEYAERGDENSLIIERILILVRNVLYVPSDPDTEKRPDYDANLHDQVLWALRQSGMLDIILYIASSPAEQVYYMHILEILSFLLREQVATNLATSALERNHTEKLRDEAQLVAVRHQESNQKREKVKQFTSARHSRFGGTFVVKSMKSIGENELIYHKPLNTIEKVSFDAGKTKPKIPRNRQPVRDKTRERHSAFSVQLFLKEFCIEFLNGAYNTLMYNVKDTLVRAKAQAHDESYYLWAVRFFMEFNRAYKFEVKLVSETVSISTFHFVQQQMEHYFDMIGSDKKKLLLWSKRLHLALLTYRELLLTLNAMDNSQDSAVKESAKVIKSNIFYVIEYRELVLTLLITYDELKMSQTYLRDLIETQHIFLKMLQKFCQKTGTVVVEEKKRKQRKKKKSKQTNAVPSVEDIWEEISMQLPQVLARQITLVDVIPYDASSDIPIEDQKLGAMKNIQVKMRNKDLEGAVALLRASREVWPENYVFGSSSISPEEEYLILQEIFHTDLGVALHPIEAVDVSDGNESDNEEEQEHFSENVFKFEDFVKRLAHPKIVHSSSLCLRNFSKNSVFTNNCIVKLLHRIAFDCKMYAMLFQVSIFRTFQNIYAQKALPQHKELVKFATYIMRQFFMVTNINPKVYIEALFWKSSKDAYDVVHGYGTYHQKSQAAQKAWTELEEQQLQVLFEEHQRNGIEEDVVDWIMNNLIENNRSRRGVMKKLKEMNLLTNYKRQYSKKREQPWTVNEEAELRDLFEQFREADDPLDQIISNLTIARPKNRIIEKLLVMGVIQDKSEIKKKRKKKSNKATADSDDRDQNVPSTSRRRNNKGNAITSKTVTKAKKKFMKQSLPELKKILFSIKGEDLHSDALEWVSESFTEAADDLESTSESPANEGIPLVPIFESYENALENETFKKFLLSCSVLQPADEQEIYWRIPNNIPPTDLRQYATLISDVLRGVVSPNEANEHTVDDVFNQEEDSFIQLRSESEDDVQNESERSDTDSNVSSQSQQRERFNNEETEDIETMLDVAENNEVGSNISSQTSTGRIRFVSESGNHNEPKQNNTVKSSRILRVSDSEDDQDEEKDGLSDTEADKRSRDGISDSDGEQPKRKRTRILSSDEE